MTDQEQPLTPADTGVVTSGLGTKTPEERKLPDSLSNDMELCLEILRGVLAEYDESLLTMFYTVRQYAVDASAERFSGVLTDTHPERDDLETDQEQPLTPADTGVVTSGLGTKTPEERKLPDSLSNDMELCLEILRGVLAEYDESLLTMFDTVRQYAVDASAERFSGALTDTHPERDDLEMAVKTIDAMNLHDAQLLARAFATYFHLANLCEENYRVSVLHEREAKVDDKQAIDPVNEMTKAYHQLIAEMGPAQAKELLGRLEFHPVFTAHPTEARRKAVEGKIRRIAELLSTHKYLGGSDKKENLRRLYNEIDALFRTSPTALKKPTPVEEADTILLSTHKYLGGSDKKENLRRLYNEIDALFRTSPTALKKPTPVEEADTILDIFDNTLFHTIPQVYRRFDDWVLGDEAGLVEPVCPAFFHPGSWIGSDRDGNPNVTAKVSRQVARKFSDHVLAALEEATRTVGRNMMMESETTPPSDELRALWNQQKEVSERLTSKASLISTQELHRAVLLVMADRLHYTIKRDHDLMYHTCDDFLADLRIVQRSLAEAGAKRAAYGPLQDDRLHYTIKRDHDLMYHTCDDFLADLRIVQRSLAEAGAKRAAYGPLQDLIWQTETFGFHMVEMEFRQHSVVHARALDDIREHGLHGERGPLQPMTHEVLDTFRALGAIQRRNGIKAARRYIISFTKSAKNVRDVYELNRLSFANPEDAPVIDVIPLFEQLEDLENSVNVLDEMIKIPEVQARLKQTGRKLEVMLGYSDSSKDAGPTTATLALHSAQERIAKWADENDIDLTLFRLSFANPEDAPVIDVIPLFEQLEDLENSVNVLDEMIKIPEVQARLKQTGRKLEVMLGYSDSSKDAGPTTATLALHSAQERIAKWADENDIDLTLFHGRLRAGAHREVGGRERHRPDAVPRPRRRCRPRRRPGEPRRACAAEGFGQVPFQAHREVGGRERHRPDAVPRPRRRCRPRRRPGEPRRACAAEGFGQVPFQAHRAGRSHLRALRQPGAGDSPRRGRGRGHAAAVRAERGEDAHRDDREVRSVGEQAQRIFT